MLRMGSTFDADWDDAYQKELKVFQECGDVGEVWFGEDSVERVVTWMDKSTLVAKESSILDLGCGNGFMLIELYKAGFRELTGVDYSQQAIDLAKAVALEEQASIKYQVCDILNENGIQTPTENALCLKYDVILDKGTYDAISLCPDDALGKRCSYLKNTWSMLKDDGWFIITTCNWTESQLLEQFDKHFACHEKIPVPTFQFGGVTGNRETAVIFKKKL